jgi:hypothetical protein
MVFLLTVERNSVASQWRIAVIDDDEFSQLEQGLPIWIFALG